MHRLFAPPSAAVLVSLAALTACETVSRVISSDDGRIAVTVATSGGSSDLAGYTTLLDGNDLRSVSRDGSLVYDPVDEGDHTVTLSGIPADCALEGSNPREVTVDGSSTSAVHFSLICGRPESGGFEIVVTTNGGPPDVDGYQLSVAGAALRIIGIEATELYTDLDPGIHLVALKDVVDHCKLQGGSPQPFTVVTGKTVQVRLVVNCGDNQPLN